MVHLVTTSDSEWYNEWQRMTTSDGEWYNEWQQVVQRVTTNDNEWQRMTTSDSEWYNEWQRVATIDKKWQCVAASDSSGTTNENGTVHFKEWMIGVLPMTKTDTLLLQGMDGCN